MSDVQKAMALLIGAFNRYSTKEGDSNTLSKAELKELLQNEFRQELENDNGKAALEQIFKDLDTNKDNSVDFREYVTLVSCITQRCHEYFHGKK